MIATFRRVGHAPGIVGRVGHAPEQRDARCLSPSRRNSSVGILNETVQVLWEQAAADSIVAERQLLGRRSA